MHVDANENNLHFWSLANKMEKCKYRRENIFTVIKLHRELDMEN